MTDTNKDNDEDQDTNTDGGGARKVIYAAIVANLGIAVAKFIVAAITGSAAMLAEGIHSAVDTGNEFLLLIGERNSAKPADKRHPFGYGKALYFWALLVALSVFSLGGGLSIDHGISALRRPEPLQDPLWNYVVLAVSACFEGYSWNVSRRELNKRRKPGTSLWQTVHASKDASVFTVFIEDTAALLGLAIAAAGITLGYLFDSRPAARGRGVRPRARDGRAAGRRRHRHRSHAARLRDPARRPGHPERRQAAQHAARTGRRAADGGRAVPARHAHRRSGGRDRTPRTGRGRGLPGHPAHLFRIRRAALGAALTRARPRQSAVDTDSEATAAMSGIAAGSARKRAEPARNSRSRLSTTAAL